ncbi:N-acetylmuramoyl-L-alanine amidase CwlD [Priestia taiwanensis]|uniref:N-acetylmuramoyl-L-alanine amidase CwlD n=1 Tax=Priestia taiwanensis TaxID=1347902 RepID=A0A917ERW5_9BACI|nr:N-acetylmuramoyl-L-alanine amidase CwlD [Priestia taiwanensis]MBM7365082.1 N-acetylmuramoyl-L-alanine amidase [Priestia taiwanensis]GGE84380.1 N-acetylmuramoyl-L-alanine amidase CwlD [Priestia taiwanensis]
MKRIVKYGSLLVAAILLFFLVKHTFPFSDSWKQWNLPLSGKIIVLDPGHGGPDGGATKSGVKEEDITLLIAEKTRDYLQEQGALVLLTREGDYDLADKDTKSLSRRKAQDLKSRVELINSSNADFFVSIHLNSFPSSNSQGAQTFYYHAREENERAAKFVQDEFRKSLENTDRIAKEISRVYLLKHAKVPGVLIEAGFLSNSEERKWLKTKTYQEKVAEALYRGIMRYYTDKGDPPD